MHRRLFNLAAAVSLVLMLGVAGMFCLARWPGRATYGIEWTDRSAFDRPVWVLGRRGLVLLDPELKPPAELRDSSRMLASMAHTNSQEFVWVRSFDVTANLAFPAERTRVPVKFRALAVPFAPWLLTFAILPCWWLASKMLHAHRSRFRAAAGHCTACGYDLRATPGRCPECGMVPALK